jgi:N-dimethylarginine dimethylaminohydrolase
VQTRETFTKLGVPVSNIPGQEGLPDLVYCANLGLSYPVEGSPSQRPIEMYISNMAKDARRGEMRHYAEACKKMGYDVSLVFIIFLFSLFFFF